MDDDERKCEQCGTSYPTKKLTCANTTYSGSECDCGDCELYCFECFEED